MKRILGLALIALLQACGENSNCVVGSGPVVSQEFPVAEFTEISLDIAGNVTLIEASEQKVIIESQQNVIDQLNNVVSDDTWAIRFRKCMRNYSKFEVTIYTPKINGVLLSGSGNVSSQGNIPSDNLVALLSGSGNLSMETNTELVSADISGSGNITLTGSASAMNFSVSGSGNINAFGMEANTCDVSISGSGNCQVDASDALVVNISGSGSVQYKGNPTVNSNISGSGEVIKVD